MTMIGTTVGYNVEAVTITIQHCYYYWLVVGSYNNNNNMFVPLLGNENHSLIILLNNRWANNISLTRHYETLIPYKHNTLLKTVIAVHGINLFSTLCKNITKS